jgi:16S rRNA (cytidine1402-2'-O)-methyltransferase
VLISTPIGNLGDLSRRAAEALAEATVILCEDTRTTARLLSTLGIRARTEPLHEHNEEDRIPSLLARLAEGATLALVSDAGTPLVSDPGYRLVRAAIAAGHTVSAIPGANAAVMALTISGLPPHPFLFLGFPPPRQAARQEAFRQQRAVELTGLRATAIWYEAPHRLVEMLDDVAQIFGDRDAAVARELTKHFEEVRRGTPASLAEHFRATPPRGEITVLLGPAMADDSSDVDLDAQLREAMRTLSVKDAASHVAASSALPRRVVYARALKLRETD